MLVYSWAFWWY